MSKDNSRELALRALSGAAGDPAPKPLLGTKSQPGIFAGAAQATKRAAALCIENGWIEATGEFIGKGKSRKELHRITSIGLREAIEHDETANLLRDMLAALDQKRLLLEDVKSQLEAVGQLITSHRSVLEQLLDKAATRNPTLALNAAQVTRAATSSVASSASAPDGWLAAVAGYLDRFQHEHPYQHCSLPELYEHIARTHRLSIGQYHDGLRKLMAAGSIRLHPFTGAPYQLQHEQYALLAGQEIKYYAEHLGGMSATPAR